MSNRMTSEEWHGRAMMSTNPDPLLYELMVSGPMRREAREKHEVLIEAAYTPEAKAWNRLSDMAVSGREVIVYIPAPISWSRALSTPDEAAVREVQEFLFRKRQERGGLCDRWELVSSR